MVGSDLEFGCKLGGDRFATSVGLIQHQRHTHPAEYNGDRMTRHRGLGKEFKESGLWFTEVVEALVRLERVFER